MTSTHIDRRTVLAGGAGLALSLIDRPIPAAEACTINLAPGSPLKIESIEAFWLHDGSKMGGTFPRLFVRIYTDQGIVGEAYTFFSDSWNQVIPLLNDGIAPRLIGMDAMQIESCWQGCWPALDVHFARGLGNSILPQFTRALAAVDTALWDAVGKALETPCYKMWGAYTNELPVVSFDQRYRHPGVNYDPAKFASHMAELIEMGYSGVKLKPGRPPFKPAEDAEWVGIVREAVGPDFIIQADANLRWNVEDAIDFGQRVQNLDLRWLEQPCRTRREMARVRAGTGLPICAGQSEITIDGAHDLMVEDAIDICNYNPGYACGPSAWRKIYGLASSFGVEMSVHQQPQIAAHLMAATPHGEKHGIEIYMRDVDPYFYDMIENQTPIENGKYRLPEGPGFGFVYDKDIIAKYRNNT